MSENNCLRLGIIGCGRVAAERHLPALRRLREFRLTAAADINDEALDRFAALCGIERRFTDYRKLLECLDIDAVAILTPTGSHAEITATSLRPVSIKI